MRYGTRARRGLSLAFWGMLLSCGEGAEPPPPPVAVIVQGLEIDIEDCADLQAMQDDLTADYTLLNDIDCSSYSWTDGHGFKPVGFGGTVFSPFEGTFDGNGYIISGLTIDRPYDNWVGLFGLVGNASITRVGLVDVDISGWSSVGALAGGSLNSSITECFSTGSVAGNNTTGGLVGLVKSNGHVYDSYTKASVAITTSSTEAKLITGPIQYSAQVRRSYAASSSAGVISGALSNSGTIDTSFFDCTTSGNCSTTGGQSTSAMQSSTIYNTAGWDFDDVWGFDGANTYPCLLWEDGCGCSEDDATCDDIDDDCDSTADEDYVSDETTCGVGACASTGDTSCEDGDVEDSCTPGTPASSDTSCDGVDDDCSGTNDEDYSSTGTTCGVGACASTGSTSCVSGSVQDSCTPGTPASNDTSCNGVDDDCSGTNDEDYSSTGTTCGVGACASTGSTSCVSGSVQDSCTPGTPASDDTSCNGVDNDCSGTNDEDYVPTGTTCERDGCAAEGQLQCTAGEVVDSCPSAGTCVAEIDCDDDADNDEDSDTDCADLDCAEVEGCRETLCNNDFDDNDNGLTDCDDPACEDGPPCIPEVCGNSIDDDGDGFIDCSDLGDCEEEYACLDLVPPLAETIAPDIDQTGATQPLEAFSFLIEGGDPIQRGVASGTIEEDQVALVTGKVTVRDGTPVPAIRVEVLDHDEYGHTHTDEEGHFQMLINGGGTLTFQFTAPGYITVQRQITTKWQAGGTLDDVVIIPRTLEFSTVDTSGASTDPQVAAGPVETDEDGTRRAIIILPAGVEAQVYDENDTLQNVEELNLRMTEFTVGDNGPETMPAPLPATSAYTYAIDLTPDEAEGNKVDGVDTTLNPPAPFYVDNFLSFPVGTVVPTGYYDDDNAVWKAAEENGLVLKIVSVTSGLADLDADGDDVAEDSTALAALDITADEREMVASLYDVGDSVWRVRLFHLSTYDLNMGAGCDDVPDDEEIMCEPPPEPAANTDVLPADPPDCNTGAASGTGADFENSIVHCFSQTLSEDVAVPGTPYSLHYRTDRVRGRSVERTITLPLLSENFASTAIIGVGIRVEPAIGKVDNVYLTAAEALDDETFTWTWDGSDIYDRPVQGSMSVKFRITYYFPCIYSETARFGSYGGVPLNLEGSQTYYPRSDCRVSLESNVERTVESWDFLARGFGGWALDAHHTFEPNADVILYGDGRRGTGRQVDATESVLSVTASNGALPHTIASFAIGPDGTIYSSSTTGLYRTPPGGTWTLWKETTNCSSSNSTATQDAICLPVHVAVGKNGDVYVSDTGNEVVRVMRVDPSGDVHRVAGSIQGYNGDTGLATDARLESVCDLKVGDDGSVYVLDCTHAVVWRIGPDGHIERVAGTGVRLWSGDTFVAEAADARTVRLGLANSGLVLIPGGGFYILEGNGYSCSIRQVSASGAISTIYDQHPCSGNGPAFREGVIDASGNLILARHDSWDYWRMDQNSDPPTFARIAGNGANPNGRGYFDSIGAFPARRQMGPDPSMDIGPDGQLYLLEHRDEPGDRASRILRIRQNQRGDYGQTLVASADRSEIYDFDQFGRHARTLHGLTGEDLRTFEYDDDDLLVAIEDADGNRTEITRENGVATEIEAPFGQITTLDYEDGYLTEITPDPENDPYLFEYDEGGLMLEQTDPRGDVHIYGYDELGRVDHDEDPTGSTLIFEMTATPGVHTVTRTSELGRETTYQWTRLETGSSRYLVVFPNGAFNRATTANTGVTTTEYADGTIVASTPNPDPDFGPDAWVSSDTVTLPAVSGGLSAKTRTTTRTRARTLATSGDPLSLTSLTETTVVNGRTHTRAYSSTTNTWTMTSPVGRISTTTIDDQGRVVATTSTGTIPTDLEYDSNGRLERIEQGSERFTDLGYDPTSGFLSEETNALSEITSYTNDAVGRVTEIERADESVIAFTYDGESNMTSLTPPDRSVHEMTYTPADLAEDYEAPTVGSTPTVTTNEYNADRQLTSVTQPDEEEQQYNYHSTTGLLTSAVIPGAGTYTYGHNSAGQLDAITTDGGFGSLSFAYHRSVLRSTTLAGTQTITDGSTTIWSGSLAGSVLLDYDNALNVSSVQVQDGFWADYARDNDDLVTSITPHSGSTPTMTLSRSSLDGHLESTELGDVTTEYDVDVNATTPGTGDLLGISASFDSTEIFATSYLRDDLGRITQLDETVQSVSRTRKYEYDAVGRLTAVRDGSDTLLSEYEYDANGARTRALTASGEVEIEVDLGCGTNLEDAVDAQDRLCRYGDYNYAYDDNGRLASKTHVTTSDVTSYTYDGLGRLRTVVLEDDTRIDYVLDAMGRRIGKVVDGSLVKGWLYGENSLAPMAQLNSSGSLEATFVYGTRINVPEYIVMASGGVVYRVITDHLGSVRLVINTSSGAVAQAIDYDEFGNVLADSAPGFTPFGFAGGLYDADTGLVRFGARDYDAVTGRWTAKDPIGFGGGQTNLYAYCGNDPVNGIDPTGLLDALDVANFLDDSGIDDAAAGFGEGAFQGMTFGFGDLQDARDALGLDASSVDRNSAAFCRTRGLGRIAGGLAAGGLIARGLAGLGGTRMFHALNHNRYLRFGPGRMPANGRLPSGTGVPRASAGGPGGPHVDLRMWPID